MKQTAINHPKLSKICLTFLLTLSLLLGISGCAGISDMPYNGDIQFHGITMTIPSRFVRDSTQSSVNLWIFEHGTYSEYVILSRSDLKGEVSATLESYVEFMKEQDANSEITTFLSNDAVLSRYSKDGEYCQEILFPLDGSLYAIALRGGSEEGFQEIMNSIQIP